MSTEVHCSRSASSKDKDSDSGSDTLGAYADETFEYRLCTIEPQERMK